ncbi:MAG: ABC transporter permease [Planctomycetota bacterium]
MSPGAATIAQEPRELSLPDPLTLASVDEVCARFSALERGEGPVVVSLEGVRSVDGFGLAALAAGLERLRELGRAVEVRGAPARARRLAAFLRFDAVLDTPPPARPDRLERLGEQVLGALAYATSFLALLADALRGAVPYLARGGRLVRRQLWRQLDEAGFRAIPIVCLLNAMIGLILAIQVAYVLRAYGALEMIPRFVGISITREIGPLLTAVVVAGRSGSAMAAALGTMHVTEELDALRLMGLPPRRFLVLPRVAALTLAVPALFCFAVVAGLLGGAAVGVLYYDIGAAGYYRETAEALQLRDLGSGLLKSFCFGTLVAATGCLQGLRLSGGTEEVGRAATRGVVHGIVAIVCFDAVFTALTKELL